MGRSPCCEKQHTNKGAWTKEEDHSLITYIKSHGEGSWRSLPKFAGLQRCGKSCRLRWINYLRPDLKRGNFTEEEDEVIINLHGLLGNKWSLIAARLSGRTDNEIKNYWNTHIKRKLISRGIDPQTHRSLQSPATINATATTPKTTSTDYYTHDSTFQLINNIQAGSGSRLDLAPNSINNGDQDSNSASSIVTVDEVNYGEINLDLSISLPSPKSKNDTKIQQKHILGNIHHACFCYNLGFQKKGRCNCTSTLMEASTTMKNIAGNDHHHPFYETLSSS